MSQNASANSKRLAELVQAELVKEHKRTNRGLKTDIAQSGINIAVLRHTNMPVILIESGFMDNLEEAKTMLDPEFQKADAEATCRGIASSSVLHMFQKKKKRMLYIVSKSEHITIRTMPIKREKG
nr:N-acetylmuramoyl-L-alanine amidase [uncultured Anaerocolumna sp.]